MLNPYRFADLPEARLEEIMLDMVRHTGFLQDVLSRAQELNFPHWRVVSGALYNTVWNHLTGRPEGYGIKDVDIFYYDPDTSWAAEDHAIKRATGFPAAPPVELRNQARVHLWFAKHFGYEIAPITSVEDGIDRFASTTHCVGLRVVDGCYDLYAPYGLRSIFEMKLRPNPVQDNRATHEAKGARQQALWPELELIPWPSR
jgi:hypothetical protein